MPFTPGTATSHAELPQDLTVDAGAAPSATLTGLLIVFGSALLLVIPAIALLYTLAQRSLIEETTRPGAHADGSLTIRGSSPYEAAGGCDEPGLILAAPLVSAAVDPTGPRSSEGDPYRGRRRTTLPTACRARRTQRQSPS